MARFTFPAALPVTYANAAIAAGEQAAAAIARSWRGGMLGLALASTCLAFPGAAAAERRVALVIGNAAYQHAGELVNPKNDAIGMAAELKKTGFEVIEGLNLDKAAMDAKIRDFAALLSGADTGLFFYAGHGLQVGGVNYLVPIDAKLTTASALDFQMVRFDLIQTTMERETQSNILFLDACRDNPLARNLARALGTRSAHIGRGLAAAEAGVGTLISYSTQPDAVALDGTGRNSPFTGALIQQIAQSDGPLTDLLIAVRNDVVKTTNGKQVPWEHSALTGRFYFKKRLPTDMAMGLFHAVSAGPVAAGPALAGPVQMANAPALHNAAVAEWALVDKTSAIELETFIRRHGTGPQGAYAAAHLAAVDRRNKESITVETTPPITAVTAIPAIPAVVKEQEPVAPKREEPIVVSKPQLGTPTKTEKTGGGRREIKQPRAVEKSVVAVRQARRAVAEKNRLSNSIWTEAKFGTAAWWEAQKRQAGID